MAWLEPCRQTQGSTPGVNKQNGMAWQVWALMAYHPPTSQGWESSLDMPLPKPTAELEPLCFCSQKQQVPQSDWQVGGACGGMGMGWCLCPILRT